jgi:hypothetical protein
VAITVKTPTTTAGGFGNAATTIAVPTGTAAGDLLVLIEQVSKESTAAPTIPTGFTQIGSTATRINSGSCGASVVAYRWATSEPGSYSISGTGGGTLCPFMFSLTGVDTTTPFDVNPTWASLTSGATAVAAPSITTQTAGAVLITCHAALYGTGAVTWTTPSGMSAGVIDRSGNYENAAVFSQTITTAGATGTRTSTVSQTPSGQPQALSLAIRAAASASPPTGFSMFG